MPVVPDTTSSADVRPASGPRVHWPSGARTSPGRAGNALSQEVLYRRWRPQSFADVVGQDPITTTLRNAVNAGTPAHAYLFCGPRGTGKTTTGRILAKAVNCEAPLDGEPVEVTPPILPDIDVEVRRRS